MTDDDRQGRDEHDPREKHDKRGRSDDAVTRRDSIEHRPNPENRGQWLSAVVAVLGVALIAAALLFDLATAQVWNAVAVGAALLAAGAYNYYRRSRGEFASAGVASLAALLGLWLVAAPFLVGPGSGPGSAADGIGGWTVVIAGVAAFAASTYSAYAIRARRRAADPRPTAVYDRRGQ